MMKTLVMIDKLRCLASRHTRKARIRRQLFGDDAVFSLWSHHCTASYLRTTADELEAESSDVAAELRRIAGWFFKLGMDLMTLAPPGHFAATSADSAEVDTATQFAGIADQLEAGTFKVRVAAMPTGASA